MTGAAPRPERAGTSLVGRVIRGRYRVVDTLGVGSLGTVYLCDDLPAIKKVALKVFRREFSRDEEFMRRLRRQVKLAARISEKHPSILAVYECDWTDDVGAFITTEYVQGRSLKDVIRRAGPLDVPRALRLACQIADALDAIHNMGFVHADVRPENVIVVPVGVDEIAKLKGFEVTGLRETALVDHLVRAGVVPSHAEYVAPEQVEGDQLTLRTDIYAFGVVLYEMLTGRVPFSASSADSIMAKHLQEAPQPLSAIRRELPSVLELRVKQALEKEPDRRQRYVGDVANEYLCELAADELLAEATPQKHGMIGRAATAFRTRLPLLPGFPAEGEPMGTAWKVSAVAALGAAVFFVALWMFPSLQMPLRNYASSFQQRWSVPAPLERERPVLSEENAPLTVPPPVPVEVVPRAPDTEAMPSQVPEVARTSEPQAPEKAEGASTRTQVVSPATAPPPRESTLRPPGTSGRAQKSSRPLERMEPPTARQRKAPADPVTMPVSPSGETERMPARGTPDPTAIVDWLLGPPGIKE